MNACRWMLVWSVLGALAVFPARDAVALEGCGRLNNAYGPFDYWTDKDKLGIVEGAHFTPEVEQLRSGRTSYIGGDIDYTLRAFPNHPRALMSMMRLGEKERTERPRGVHYPVACYFDRAIRFRPNDGMARMIYATYLSRLKKHAEALEHLRVAEEHAADNANLHYNLGLIYLELGQAGNALTHAHKAYRLGFQLPGLRAKLEKAGKWRDPEPEPAAAEGDKPEGEAAVSPSPAAAAPESAAPSSPAAAPGSAVAPAAQKP